MAQTATHRYLEILGLGSLQELERTIVGEVEAALYNSKGSTIPVRLQAVAEQFQIRPKPSRDPLASGAKLRYNSEAQEFVITLPGSGSSSERWARFRADRFAYAHEFAHRFLYVKSNGRLRRALAVAVGEASPGDRLRVARVLSLAEEKVCNYSAGRLLVPLDALNEFIASRIALDPSICDTFGELVELVADEFEVSIRCAIRRLIAERPASLLSALPGEFFCMLLAYTRDTGAGQGRLALRVHDSWQKLGSLKGVKPPHWGSEALEQGERMEAFLRQTMETEESVSAGQARVPLYGRTPDKQRVSCELAGHWRAWGRGRHRQILVFGMISKNA